MIPHGATNNTGKLGPLVHANQLRIPIERNALLVPGGLEVVRDQNDQVRWSTCSPL